MPAQFRGPPEGRRSKRPEAEAPAPADDDDDGDDPYAV